MKLPQHESTLIYPFTVLKAKAVTCSFTADLCQWVNEGGDQTDWTRGSGCTPSHHTDPCTDPHLSPLSQWYDNFWHEIPHEISLFFKLLCMSVIAMRLAVEVSSSCDLTLSFDFLPYKYTMVNIKKKSNSKVK